MSYFEKAFNKTLGFEGGYSDHENDKGGKTNFGITSSVAKAHGYDVETLTLNQAKNIYENSFWRKEFDDFNEKIACFLFDCNVNHGYKGMSIILQRSVNYLTRDNIKVDGYAGNITYSRASKLNENRLFTILNAVRCKYFLDICINNETQEDFIYGWLKNRIFWSEV